MGTYGEEDQRTWPKMTNLKILVTFCQVCHTSSLYFERGPPKWHPGISSNLKELQLIPGCHSEIIPGDCRRWAVREIAGAAQHQVEQCSTRSCFARGGRFVLILLYIEQSSTWCCIALGASRVAPVFFGCPCRSCRGRFQHVRFSSFIQGRLEFCTGQKLFK